MPAEAASRAAMTGTRGRWRRRRLRFSTILPDRQAFSPRKPAVPRASSSEAAILAGAASLRARSCSSGTRRPRGRGLASRARQAARWRRCAGPGRSFGGSPGGTTLLINPRSRAVPAWMTSPVSNSSSARARGMRRGNAEPLRCGEQAALDFGQTEDRVLGRHDQVAGEHELAAAARAAPLTAAMHGFVRG